MNKLFCIASLFVPLMSACADTATCSQSGALSGAEALCSNIPTIEVYQNNERLVGCPSAGTCAASFIAGDASFVLTADNGLTVTGVTISDDDVVEFISEFATPQEVTAVEIPVRLSTGTATVTFEGEEPLHVDLTVE